MTHHWDEFSKSVPRRESLSLLGAALAGALLGPLGAGTAWAGRRDPCQTFCKCSNKNRQNACLAACRACGGETSRLCGSCGSGYVCTDLANDVHNCGACGHVCSPGQFEDSACFDGTCVYACVEGAVRCGGTCTLLELDPENCGACGNVCPEWASYCDQGTCRACAPGLALCGDSCVDLGSNPDHCGACGNICGGSTPYCSQGVCTFCGGFGVALCSGECVNILSDSGNCGACGVECAADELCTFGVCLGTGSGF